MKFRCVFVAVLAVGFGIDVASGQFPERPYETRIRKRAEEIEELLKTVRAGRKTPEEREAAGTAIYLLGKLRAKEAVPALAQLLTVEYDVWEFDFRATPIDFCDAPRALAEIGGPAVGAMLRKITSETATEREKVIAAWIILKIYYDETPEAYEDMTDAKLRSLVYDRIIDWTEKLVPVVVEKEKNADLIQSASEAIELVLAYVPSRGRFDDIATIVTRHELPGARVGERYRVKIEVTGPKKDWWKGPVFRVVREDLPPGMTLDENGVLTGTPEAAGEWEFPIYVHGLDEKGERRDEYAAKMFLLDVR